MSEADVARLKRFATTKKQLDFEWDFRQGVDRYETWDRVRVGDSGPGMRTFLVEEEDILAFNLSCLETDPMYVDPGYALEHGGLWQHPLFIVQVVFYCIDTGIGSWLRSPGARNPGQTIDLFEPFIIGETITATITHADKWIRRGKNYIEDTVELHNESGVLKAVWRTRLIIPPNLAELQRYAGM
jgi:acyl dehydratase